VPTLVALFLRSLRSFAANPVLESSVDVFSSEPFLRLLWIFATIPVLY
jgi:hypothetical protein